MCYNRLMARIVVGNRDGALALAQGRSVLSDLAAEWPDLQLIQRSFQAGGPREDDSTLFQALAQGSINIAMVNLARLPKTLPEGLTLAAVTRRLEARSALVAKGRKRLEELGQGAVVGVQSERDQAFLRALDGGLDVRVQTGTLDACLSMLAAGEFDALVVPSATLVALDRRDRIDALLEPEVFPPAVGQGSVGLLVREDDDLASEVAYTLRHRPSLDRVMAELSFRQSLTLDLPVGAYATVTHDGELTLFGAVVDTQGTVLQATITGEAQEAAELGKELAQDVEQQLKSLAETE